MARASRKSADNGKRLTTRQSVRRRDLVDLRHHAPLQLRRRAAVRPGADLDPLPAHPRRARGGARPSEAEAVGAEFTPVAGSPLPLAGLGRPRRRRSGRELDRRRAGRRSSASSTASCCPHLRGPARAARTPRRARRSSARSCPASSGCASTPSATSCDVLDKVHEISAEAVDATHVFTLSQVYEGLLLKMGEKGNDGGQFFTPREVIRAMVRVDRPAARRDGLRPRLRHGRLPGPGLRAHAPGPGDARSHRRSARRP